MEDPEEKQIARLLASVSTDIDDYPYYRRGILWGVVAFVVAFAFVFLPVLLISLGGTSSSNYLSAGLKVALCIAGVLAVIFWGFGTFRPRK